MRISNRLKHLPEFSIQEYHQGENLDPEVLKLDTVETDLLPPFGVIESTKQALFQQEFNTYLPVTGKESLRKAIALKITNQTNKSYHPDQVIITNGATEAMLDVLLAVTNPGDEVLLTDPTHSGMIHRVSMLGAIPKLIPFRNTTGNWRLDLDYLKKSISPVTKALFLMNPSMPSGAVLNLKEWQTIAKICIENKIWLIYNAAMERILFENHKVIHPCTLEGMENQTIILGSVSKEHRMVGWRIGWMVGPENVVVNLAKAHIYNVITPPGANQNGALTALQESSNSFKTVLEEWEKRRDIVGEQLKHYSMIPAAGGWSQLLDVSNLGMDAKAAAKQLYHMGKVAVTPMNHWGLQNGSQFIRIVFSNESVERLSTLGERFFRTFSK